MLASKLGYVDVDKMLSEITSRQLSEWIAHHAIDMRDTEQARLRAKAEAGIGKHR